MNIETGSTPADKGSELRADIERLFSPPRSHIIDTPGPRDIFFARNTWRRIYPNVVPKEASDIALEAYELQHGAPSYNFYRGQTIKERFGRRIILSDVVIYSMTDDSYSGGRGECTPFSRHVDLLQPHIEYDERFARINESPRAYARGIIGFKPTPIGLPSGSFIPRPYGRGILSQD
jgi:hypothetical protein